MAEFFNRFEKLDKNLNILEDTIENTILPNIQKNSREIDNIQLTIAYNRVYNKINGLETTIKKRRKRRRRFLMWFIVILVLFALWIYYKSNSGIKIRKKNVQKTHYFQFIIGPDDSSISINLSIYNFVNNKIKIWGSSTNLNIFVLEYSVDNANWHGAQTIPVIEHITGEFRFETLINYPPKYIRFRNISGVQTLLEIYIELFLNS